MKFIFSQMAFFMAQESNKRNLRFMARFAVGVLLLIVAYSALFHMLMAMEGRDYSALTGLYWTLTVMSTLGSGDITFTGDLGKLFSVAVLLSGLVIFMVVMPFTFIRFVYAPWLEAQRKAILPREVAEGTKGHVLLVGTGGIALSVINRLRKYAMPCFLLMADGPEAVELFDKGYPVVSGEKDSAATYEKLRVRDAALVVALHDDMQNTNIAATVREVAPKATIAGSADHVESLDVLRLAGCTHVYHFARMLGRTLARRVFGPDSASNIIGRFDELCIAETPAAHSPYVGKLLRETDFRTRFGINVVGVWQGKEYKPALPDTLIDNHSVLLLAGTSERLERYDREVKADDKTPRAEANPVLILGGGRVGKSVAADLAERRIPFRVVEQDPNLVPRDDPNFLAGNAADFETLSRAGIGRTNTVIVTTHNDDLNIYLTIYCRKLRPDAQVISRSTLDRNVPSLYSAGASLVISHATMAANAIVNLLSPGKVFLLTEGLNIFRIQVPASLLGVTLKDSGIRSATRCNVVAIHSAAGLEVNPVPDRAFTAGDVLILIGTVDAEQTFMRTYRVR
jgi:Trk K+ transport system NAD-binding subunit